MQSDLINSYAWDTTIVFLQTFDNRINPTKPYSLQNSLNTDKPINNGTNNNSDLTKIDRICNIYDMASNCVEWSTESVNNSWLCTHRGGCYDNYGSHSSSRYRSSVSSTNSPYSFRPILYL